MSMDMLLGAVVTRFTRASWIATIGWVANATPPVEPLGCWVNASFAGDPTVMLRLVLVAELRVPSVAVRVYPVPALSILQAVKLARPLLAGSGLVVQVRV